MNCILYTAADVEGIERATVETVSPEGVEERDGWLLAFDSGTIGRAKSAVPLSHAFGDPQVIAPIEARYADHGVPAQFRLPDIASFAVMHVALASAGYRGDRLSLVQIAAAIAVRALVENPEVTTADKTDHAWGRVFLGDGFDPVDGASRVKALSRAPDAVYASVRDGDGAIAAGAASFGHGWASIHAMRTALARRREGLAGRILSALAQVALDRGYERIFLQVEENNEGAQSLYARAGFANAWRYAYWHRA